MTQTPSRTPESFGIKRVLGFLILTALIALRWVPWLYLNRGRSAWFVALFATIA